MVTQDIKMTYENFTQDLSQGYWESGADEHFTQDPSQGYRESGADEHFTQDLSQGYWESGADYLIALKKLGLNPDALFWAFDEVVEKMVLIIVTPIYDVAGSLKLTKTLVKAYNLAATPKEISPFILRLHSPDQAIIRKFYDLLEEVKPIVKSFSKRNEHHVRFGEEGNIFTQLNFIYKFDIEKKDKIKSLREWKRFNDNVERLERLAA